jgi:hypothetical protein
VEEVVSVEIEAPPREGRLRGTLQELAGRVAEELRHVHALDLSRGRRGASAAGLPVAEEIGQEVVEEAAPAAQPVGHALFRQVDLAEVLDLLRSIGPQPDPRRYCRSSMTLAHVLDRHLNPLSLS